MKNFDKRNEVGDLVYISKYSRVNDGKKEEWHESVGRVMKMHWDYVKENIDPDKFDKFKPLFSEVFDEYLNKNILGAQRALQFGGEQLLKHHTRMYNCSSSYCDRVGFFKELMYILLCGAGAGYSVQKCHINKLPIVKGWNNENVITYEIPDSIEGWSESIDLLIRSFFFNGDRVWFDFSKIRPKGAPISGGFKAPGPEPLKEALMKIKEVLKSATGRKLRPFEAHRISCLLADAVVSGGVRRSALLCLFDATDEEMLHCKTGKWWHTNLELARSNNSAVILQDTPFEVYNEVFEACKQFGEPGFAFLKNTDYLYNPLIIAA